MKVFYKDGITEEISKAPDTHFRYGTGLFETLLYDGAVHNIQAHLDRLNASMKTFGFVVKDFDYGTAVKTVVDLNGLSASMARINICHIFESETDYAVFVSAAAYTPPPADKVFSLCVYPYVHQSYMSRHKTMNYMHFLTARKYALEQECDDALLTDAFGNVLETSTMALVLKDGSSYYVPKSENRLPSIAQKAFAERKGAVPLDIKSDELHKFEIFVMNSLMGVRKAEIR